MTPCLLIASPQMTDPFFEKAVVLMWHHDDNGAIGVVVNKFLPHTLPEVLQTSEDTNLTPYASTQVAWGGPVESQSGTVLTKTPIEDDEGWTLTGGIHVTRSQEALTRLLRDGEPILLCLGYAGWGPGQLEAEIVRGGWLLTDLNGDIVFDIPESERYDLALATLGLTASTVWMQPISE